MSKKESIASDVAQIVSITSTTSIISIVLLVGLKRSYDTTQKFLITGRVRTREK